MVTPQITVCSVNLHIRTSVGTSVQVTVVWLVVVGQLPQFDARMLYWMARHSGANGFLDQLKVSILRKLSNSEEPKLTTCVHCQCFTT